MSPYAAETEVPVQTSKRQIEVMLQQRGAAQFATGWDDKGGERLQFKLHTVTIRFTLPPLASDSWQYDKAGRVLKAEHQQRKKAQIERTRWRQLYLVIKAKLEAVDAGIAVYEEEFLAFVVMANGQTIGDVLTPQVQAGTPRLRLGDGQ